MSEPVVKNAGQREEVWTPERCFITELVNDPAIPEWSLARCRVPPGTTTQLHVLSVAEWYVVDKGHGLMEIGAEPAFDVTAGDTVAIPEGTSQRITNKGDADLIFQCLCIPRFTQDCYQSLEGD
jgi:mannose-6-phosphate isomerase-like protein (cupin superfamily)